jgi:hypothetical protein
VQIIGGPYKVAQDGVHIIEVTDGQVVELLPETCEAWIRYGKAKLPEGQAPENKMIEKAPEIKPGPVDIAPLVAPHKRTRRRK